MCFLPSNLNVDYFFAGLGYWIHCQVLHALIDQINRIVYCFGHVVMDYYLVKYEFLFSFMDYYLNVDCFAARVSPILFVYVLQL